MCTPLRHSTYHAVNADWARDLQILSLTLSQLSYPRNVVTSDLILALLIFKEVEPNFQYHEPHKYRFMMSFSLVRDHEQLFYTFRGVWMLVSVLFINHILNMLHENYLIFTQIYFNLDFSRCLCYLVNKLMVISNYTYFLLVKYN